MIRLKPLAAATLAAALVPLPAAAELIEFSFADGAAEPNIYNTSEHAPYAISGSLVIDTSAAPISTYIDSVRFDSAALVSFSAVVTDTMTGLVVNTLGINPAADARAIQVVQGYAGPHSATSTNLSVVLGNYAGVSALSGATGNFTIGFNTFGLPVADGFVDNLLYDDPSQLLHGIQLSPAIDRGSFNVTHPGFGGTGVTTSEIAGRHWMLDTVAVTNVTPVPEPATWASLAAGLSVLSLLARRRLSTGDA